MKTLFEVQNMGSYNRVFVDNGTINYISLDKKSLVHKQIERKGGKTYMRMIKRGLNHYL